jgi:integrase
MITGLEEEARKNGQDNYGINKIITCMRTALRWAMDKGYIEDFPIENLSLLPTEKPRPHTNGLKEIELLLKHGTAKERVIVFLGFDCGLRPEEIFNLRWEKLDLETRFGWISPNPDGWHPKRNKSRQFRITERLLKELEALGIEAEGYVIKNAYGAKFTQQGYNVFWRKFVKSVNRKIRPQKITGTLKTLRKDYCTFMQAAGADTKSVSLSMGHADIKVTQQHYTDAQQEALRQAREQEERDNLLALEKYEVPLKYDNKEQKE